LISSIAELTKPTELIKQVQFKKCILKAGYLLNKAQQYILHSSEYPQAGYTTYSQNTAVIYRVEL
jgi:hypothetical protein